MQPGSQRVAEGIWEEELLAIDVDLIPLDRADNLEEGPSCCLSGGSCGCRSRLSLLIHNFHNQNKYRFFVFVLKKERNSGLLSSEIGREKQKNKSLFPLSRWDGSKRTW